LSTGLENVVGVRPKIRAILGDAAAVIQEAAEEGKESTLVVVGRRGMGGVRRFVLGSVSSDVLRSVSGPVLIVP
jgi:nucleotide-binding universal stress UspA family protein